MSRYIDAEQAKTKLKHWCMETAINNVGSVIGYPEDIYADVAQNRIDIWIDNVPTADVQEVKHGKWVDIKIPANYSNEVQYQSAKCSVCKRYHTTPYLYMYYEHNYCPNCGARMDGGNNEQEERVHH